MSIILTMIRIRKYGILACFISKVNNGGNKSQVRLRREEALLIIIMIRRSNITVILIIIIIFGCKNNRSTHLIFFLQKTRIRILKSQVEKTKFKWFMLYVTTRVVEERERGKKKREEMRRMM